jgi:Raf kinase inhibitor-like YbhB/YbcL family protein
MQRALLITLLGIIFFLSGCGQEKTSIPNTPSKGGENMMKLESQSFTNNSSLPKEYTCDGENIAPALSIKNPPIGAKSLALIMDDPDAPSKTWVHWVIWNIDPSTSTIEENTKFAHSGINDFNNSGYGGPCPPSGTHRYFFKLYALDTLLELPLSTRKKDLLEAMKGHIVESTELIGLYTKK